MTGVNDKLYIAGISSTKLGKRPDASVKQMVREAVEAALADAGASVGDIDAAWFSNTRQPMLEGQNTVRGQIALRPLGFESVPVVNIENACASGSSARCPHPGRDANAAELCLEGCSAR